MINCMNRLSRGLMAASRYTDGVPNIEWDADRDCYCVVVSLLYLQAAEIDDLMRDLGWEVTPDLDFVFPLGIVPIPLDSQLASLYNEPSERVYE